MMKNVSRTVRLPVSLMVFTLCFGGLVGFGVLAILVRVVHSLWVHDDFVFSFVVAQKRKDSIEVRTHRCCVHPFLSKELLRYGKKPYHQNSYKERSSLMLKRIATHGSQQTARVSSFVSPWLVTQ
mmetsp:Transcript_1896/g.4522  ORF Transcript_1896/g.4522 Transcript_1896/m.4522 type:complete len:125 (-) Transcript_1896:180-554(-)